MQTGVKSYHSPAPKSSRSHGFLRIFVEHTLGLAIDAVPVRFAGVGECVSADGKGTLTCLCLHEIV